MTARASLRWALALLAGFAGAAAAAQSGPRSVVSATADAEIVAHDLSLTENYELQFGLVKSNSTAGTVLIKPQGTRSPFGGATTVGSGPCQTEWCEDPTDPSNVDSASYWGPGVFVVTGSPHSTYRVAAGTSSALAYWRTPATGRTPQLTVTDFTFATASSGYTSATGTLDANGTDTVRVGGTLQVIAGMNTASYRVHVPVIVQYN